MREVVPGAVLFVADVARMADFYAGLAGMARVDGDATHVVLAIPGFELVIHALRGEPHPPRDAGGAPALREDTYVKLCLPVDGIAAARERAERLGGQLWPAAREWAGRGFRACDGRDPEGNVLQVREPALPPA